MEDDDLDKTEPATPRRLEKAREEGQVTRSRELNTFLLLATGVAMLWLLGGALFQDLSGGVRASMGFDPQVGRDAQRMVDIALATAGQALRSLLPLFGALVVVAILASISLGGLLFSAKALAFKGERLDPIKGVKRMFSAQTMVELLKTLGKVVCVGTVAVLVLRHYQDAMLALMFDQPQSALVEGMRLVALCCGLIVMALLLIVLIDAPWQVYSHHKKLRMSRQDLKQEHKESEGDPHVKARIRQQQRSMARRRMMTAVPTADVVITNPSHFAVALRYDAQGQGAPRVVAKGRDLLAQRIRELARVHRVPVLAAPPLARALYRHVSLEQEIPAALYAAVAEVLAWVYQLRRAASGAGPRPTPPRALDVPAAFDPQQRGVDATGAA